MLYTDPHAYILCSQKAGTGQNAVQFNEKYHLTSSEVPLQKDDGNQEEDNQRLCSGTK